MKHQSTVEDALPPQGVNKWEVLRELGAGRTAFGLSDRDLSVLTALVSFHQATVLGGNDADLVVHPSNKAICERLSGMPCSTMRRHLSNLVQTGFVLRKDSPNGKRYARRYGDEKMVFGFDLAPLVRRHAEICAAAEAVRAAEERLQRLRTKVSLMRRDLAGLAEYGRSLRPDLEVWDQFSDLAVLTARDLRRKLPFAELEALEALLASELDRASVLVDGKTTNMSSSDALIEQHYQNSSKDSYDLEPCLETARGAGQGAIPKDEKLENDPPLPNIPLGLVLATCHEVQTYTDQPVRHWHDLVRLADIIRPMMGISPSAWSDAQTHMGPEQAAVVVCAMLERFEDIRSPGGYLRSLTSKAAMGAFSCGPMIMALMRKDAA